VKSLANIKLRKDLSVGDSGERFVDQGKRVLILSSFVTNVSERRVLRKLR
jgi:hypothetical protein